MRTKQHTDKSVTAIFRLSIAFSVLSVSCLAGCGGSASPVVATPSPFSAPQLPIPVTNSGFAPSTGSKPYTGSSNAIATSGATAVRPPANHSSHPTDGGSESLNQVTSVDTPDSRMQEQLARPLDGWVTPAGEGNQSNTSHNSTATLPSTLPSSTSNSAGSSVNSATKDGNSSPLPVSLPSSSVATAKTAQRPVDFTGNQSPTNGLGSDLESIFRILDNPRDQRRHQEAWDRLIQHADAAPQEEVTRRLVRFLRDDRRSMRAGAVLALEKWGTIEADAALIGSLQDEINDVRATAIRILGQHQCIEAAAPLISFLRKPAERTLATRALMTIGSGAEPATLTLLQETDSTLREIACQILKEIGTDLSVQALKRVVKEWNGVDRINANRTLKSIESRL